MPRKKINKDDIKFDMIKTNKEFDILLNDIGDNIYFLFNYKWFCDYYNIIGSISKESVIRFNPNVETKDFVEFTSVGSIISVVKVAIISTNATSPFISKIIHNFSFSKYNNGILALIFKKDSMTIKYSYDIKTKPVEIDNSKYFSLSSFNKIDFFDDDDNEINDLSSSSDDDDEDNNYIVPQLKEDIVDNTTNMLSSIKIDQNNYITMNGIIEETTIMEKTKIFQGINDNIIKNVICYLSIDFENLKDIFKILGDCRVNVKLENDHITFTGFTPKNNKQSNAKLSVIYLKDYGDKDINFYINSNAITKLKSLTNNFNIISSDNKKIFKKIEMKVILDDISNPDKVSYGISIFPSNFTDNNKKNNGIDLYNSILLYIPEYN